jgi:hypothetical protein
VVTIELAAHRNLSAQQKKVVQGENFRGLAVRRLLIRACLAQYVIQDLRAAIDPEKEMPPNFQIEVVNIEGLRSVLF